MTTIERSTGTERAASAGVPGPDLRRPSLVAAVLTTGLAAGFFYAYEVSVTRGLALVDDVAYVEAMQAINATVRNAAFFASWGGALITGVLAVVVWTRRRPRTRATWCVVAGVALYTASFGMTVAGSIPLNEGLATVSTADPDLPAIRSAYEGEWNRWNRARTVASGAGFAALVLALGAGGAGRRVRGQLPRMSPAAVGAVGARRDPRPFWGSGGGVRPGGAGTPAVLAFRRGGGPGLVKTPAVLGFRRGGGPSGPRTAAVLGFRPAARRGGRSSARLSP